MHNTKTLKKDNYLQDAKANMTKCCRLSSSFTHFAIFEFPKLNCCMCVHNALNT